MHPTRSAALAAAAVAIPISLLGSVGMSHAASLITGKEVKNGSVTGKDLKDESVTGRDVKNLNGADVSDDSLTGQDLAEETLDLVPEATHAGDASTLGGFSSSDYLRKVGCQTGKVLGFARVHGLDTMPVTYTDSGTFVDATYNCASPGVIVRRTGIGHYFVKFLNNPAYLAFAQVRTDNDDSDTRVCSTLEKAAGDGIDYRAFEIVTFRCHDQTAMVDADFTLLLP